MTQSVVEKSSIPEKTWRRQTDSPTWWIAFSCGSVILHLLAFWLISSYKLSASQSGSASAIPIEFIEISPQKPPQAKPEPKPKPVLPKPSAKPIVPQNSQPAVNPSAVKPPVITNDRDAIAFNNQKIEQQQQQELADKQAAQELADKQAAQELADKQAAQELADRQAAQELADRQQQNPLDGDKIADAPTDAQGKTPPEQFQKAPQAPIPNQSNQSSGILTANWNIDTEVFFDAKPANLAKPRKMINSDIPLPPPQDGNFQPGSFLVWLIIDNQGNASVMNIETPDVARKEQYRKYAEEIFNEQKFIPASENNGNKPDFSNLPIRVNIQESSN